MTSPVDVTVSPDAPRTLRRVSDGAEVRCISQMDYVSLTSAHGYRDVTDEVTTRSETSSSDAPATPPQSAAKAAWVDHAVTAGADRGHAEAMTKEQLIAEHGA